MSIAKSDQVVEGNFGSRVIHYEYDGFNQAQVEASVDCSNCFRVKLHWTAWQNIEHGWFTGNHSQRPHKANAKEATDCQTLVNCVEKLYRRAAPCPIGTHLDASGRAAGSVVDCLLHVGESNSRVLQPNQEPHGRSRQQMVRWPLLRWSTKTKKQTLSPMVPCLLNQQMEIQNSVPAWSSGPILESTKSRQVVFTYPKSVHSKAWRMLFSATSASDRISRSLDNKNVTIL